MEVDGGIVILYGARSYSEIFPLHEALSNQTNNALRSWLVSQREWTKRRSGTYSQSSEGRTDFRSDFTLQMHADRALKSCKPVRSPAV